ncbi:hypothetical protein C8Q76DRAFT_463837 [Earliella scabrosa]|nr:hypothetical protein C8Q76DRAFT_463837 [Earliella scabrosa]
MGLPAVEIVYAPATKVVRRAPHDRELVKATFSILQQQEGLIKIYYGMQHEDQRTSYHFVVWETVEDHYRMMNNTTTYPKLKSSVGSIFEDSENSIQMLHVKPVSEPYKIFEAPVVEYAIFTLIEGRPKELLESFVDELVNAVLGGEGVVAATWGPVVERPNDVAMLIGWTSVEAHWALVTDVPKFDEMRARCATFSTYSVTYPASALLISDRLQSVLLLEKRVFRAVHWAICVCTRVESRTTVSMVGY